MTIKYTFYTDQKQALVHKPYLLRNNPPKWYSDMSSRIMKVDSERDLILENLTLPSGQTTNTYKMCPALKETMRSVIVVPCPCDILIQIENGVMNWKTPNKDVCSIDHHPNNQHPGYRSNQINVKFSSSLYIVPEDKQNSRVMFMHPFLHDEQRFEAVMGVIDLNIVNALLVNTFFMKDYDQLYTIKAGTPLCYVVPLVQDEIEIDVVQTDNLQQHMELIGTSFNSGVEYWRRKKEINNVKL